MPQGAQCYNENICSARRTMAIDICYRMAAQNSPQITYLTPWGHMSITNIIPLAAHIPTNPLLALAAKCFTPPLPPSGIYFFYESWNGCIFHPTAYDNQVFGTIDKNKIGTISDMHVSRGGSCWYHFSVCI